jgi:hypothetical protein
MFLLGADSFSPGDLLRCTFPPLFGGGRTLLGVGCVSGPDASVSAELGIRLCPTANNLPPQRTRNVRANARKNPAPPLNPPRELPAKEKPTAPTITAMVKALGGWFFLRCGLRLFSGITRTCYSKNTHLCLRVPKQAREPHVTDAQRFLGNRLPTS